MKIKDTVPRKVFTVANTIILILIAVICIAPFVNLLAISFSSRTAVVAGRVTFYPIDFTNKAYTFITYNVAFTRSLMITVQRTALGLVVNLLLIILTAYPLSKSPKNFTGRNIYSWFFVLTILFSGGLIPSYMIVRYTGLIDSIWSLVLPGSLPVFSMLVVMNYMRGLPLELEEAAYIDGASHMRTLISVILPVSKPTIATVTLFAFVMHWNSWFDGMIYMNTISRYPLQSYLQTVIINPEAFFRNTTNISGDLAIYIGLVNARTTNAAQLFLATLPILCVYPFLQKYFTAGLVLGSVKG